MMLWTDLWLDLILIVLACVIIAQNMRLRDTVKALLHDRDERRMHHL